MKDITEIFTDYYNYIYNFALRLSCHPEDALDLTQETFFKAWRKLDSLKEEEALAGWLRTICYHEFLMKIRKGQETVLLPSDDWEALEQDGALLTFVRPLPEEEVVVADQVKELQNGCFLAMVRKLSLNQRIVFSLVDMFGMEIGDAAALLSVTKQAAKGLLYRARMNLDSFFAGHCELLDEKNPCSCQAWMRFSGDRAALQKKVKELKESLDYQEKGYRYDEKTRRKLYSLYRNMPQKRPPAQWFSKVLEILEKNISK